MSDQAESQPDHLFTRWLAETDQPRGHEVLSNLITLHAEPLVRRIVAFKIAGGATHKNNSRAAADVDDVCNEAIRNLLTHLDSLKTGTQSNGPPRNFNSYVAKTAFNACNEYFRDKSPARYSLANKIRYLLTHSSQFALWTSHDGKDIAGLENMAGQDYSRHLEPSQIAEQLPPRGFKPSLIDIVSDTFRLTKEPVTFDDLLETVALATGLRETLTLGNATQTDAPPRAWEQIPDTTPAADIGIANRQYLIRLWAEIRALPLQQKGALLLNLKDATGGDIQIFDLLGIATVQQIAETLGIEPIRFATIWNELPLEDSLVAKEFGIQRQDVINRRSSARKRLANRMQDYERGN